ncbi:hypothetical protein [Sphingomonas quercus]|uniref:Entericidin n=1 Tax=Sphingomonas quercus TaxID=2842451 RepID=A0ABS6BNZ4_9SPHN|nr:hypothetical protein [Sphingomonas quercus]MBU3079372.1 hypothetical protein [Sphingomonas quercus]
MSKLVFIGIGAAAITLCGCSGSNSGAANNAQVQAGAEGSDDFNQAGQLNSGMDPAMVQDNTSGEPTNASQAR